MSHFCSITISFQYFPVIFDVNNFANTWENADMSAFDNFLRLRWSFKNSILPDRAPSSANTTQSPSHDYFYTKILFQIGNDVDHRM